MWGRHLGDAALAVAFLIGFAAIVPSGGANHPGPDAGGYVVIDQGAGLSISNYLDVDEWTVLPFTQNQAKKVDFPEGFTFDFYDKADQASVWVTDNGYVSFVEIPSAAAAPNDLSADGAQDYLAAPYWVDHNPDCSTSTETIRYGVEPARADGTRGRIWVVEWKSISLTGQSPADCTKPLSTYQLQFIEGTGVVEFHYQSTSNYDENAVAVNFCKTVAVGLRGSGAGLGYNYVSLCGTPHQGGNPIAYGSGRTMRFWKDDVVDAASQTVTVEMNKPKTFSLDVSDDPKTFQVSTSLPAGKGVLSGLPAPDTPFPQDYTLYDPLGSVTYTPPPNWEGTTSFSYVVNDFRNGPQTATVTLNVVRTVPILAVGLGDDVTVDVGQPATLTPAVSGGQAPIGCSWDIPGEPEGEPPAGCGPVTLTYNAPGFYLVTVQATDDIGQVAKDSAIVKVRCDECEPEACDGCPLAAFVASIDGLNVTFSDRSADPGGAVVEWSWDFGDGSTYLGPAPPPHVYDGFGTYRVRLRVTDADGNPSETERTLVLAAEAVYSGEAPDANPGAVSQTVTEGSVVRLGPPGGAEPGHSYFWSQTGGSIVGLSDPYAANPTFAVPEVPPDETLEFRFQFTVFDGRRESQPATVTVLAVGRNERPVADAGEDQQVVEGAAVVLDGRGSSDADGQALVYSWTQSGGPGVALDNASSATPRFTAPAVDVPTDLIFLLSVNDTRELSAPDGMRVRVVPAAEPGVLRFEADNRSVGLARVAFRIAESPFEGAQDYQWDFGDGNTSTEIAPLHRFSASGEYLVNLTVTAADGTVATYEGLVQVQVPERPAKVADTDQSKETPAATPLAALLLAAFAVALRRRRA